MSATSRGIAMPLPASEFYEPHEGCLFLDNGYLEGRVEIYHAAV
jgi:hypothetical protein